MKLLIMMNHSLSVCQQVVSSQVMNILLFLDGTANAVILFHEKFADGEDYQAAIMSCDLLKFDIPEENDSLMNPESGE
jgi:hypothetical protein